MNTNSFFSRLQVIFLALLVTQIALLVIAHMGKVTLSPDLDSVFIYTVPVIAISALVISQLISAKLREVKLNTKDTQKKLPQKLNHYITISLVRWTPIEGANILALVAFMMTHNATYLYISASLFVLFIYTYPSKTKCIQELQLDEKEQQLL